MLNKPFQFKDSDFLMIAGPCSIDTLENLESTVSYLSDIPTTAVRGGVYKMRTDSTSFQGFGELAIQHVTEAKKNNDFPFVAEITDPRQIENLHGIVDIYQVGSRNMYNYELLKELNSQDKPVILKRGFSATLGEWTKAAGYMNKLGEEKIFLCERGIRSFCDQMRNTIDINAIAYLKTHTKFKVILDPSHGTGRPELITAVSKAGIAAGCDGLIVEVHPYPQDAMSDGHQALNFEAYSNFVKMVQPLIEFEGRKILS